MNDFELIIRLSNEYDACFDRALTVNDLRKCHSWFDRKNVINDEVTVKFTSHGITIRYNTSKEQIQESCTYDSVLSVIEMHDGIMLRLSHKRLLFLQAADNREDTELLMQAMVMLEKHCKYIFRKSYLNIDKVGLFTQIAFRLRPHQGHYTGAGYMRGALILLICVTIFIATVFALEPSNNKIVSESEAVSLVATYASCDPAYRRGHINYIDLEFEDHEALTIDGCCSNADLVEKLEAIPAGTRIHLLIHPKSEKILQLDINGDLLLELHNSQNKIWKEAVAFAVIGLVMYVIALVLLVGIIRKKV